MLFEMLCPACARAAWNTVKPFKWTALRTREARQIKSTQSPPFRPVRVGNRKGR